MALLRIGIYPMAQRTDYQEDGRTKMRGSFAVLINDFWEKYSTNYTYVISKTEEAHGKRTANGTFTGVIGLLMKEEADVTFWPNSLNDVPQQLGVSPVIDYQSGSILSFPIIKHHATQMLKCSDNFEADVLYFLLAANIILGITFAVLNFVKAYSFNYAQNQFEVSRCFVNQTNLDRMKTIFSSLLILTLGGSFFFLQIFESGVGADSSVVDYSDVVNSIADIARQKHKRVIMLKNMPMTLYLKYHTNANYKQVYQRGLKHEKNLDASIFSQSVTKDDVFIAARGLCTYLGSTYCTRMYRGYWMANSWDDSISLVMYTAQNISKVWKSIIDQRSQSMSEFGIMRYVYLTNLRRMGDFTESSDLWFRFGVEDLIEEVLTDGIKLGRSISLFVAFSFFTSVSGFIFILELLFRI